MVQLAYLAVYYDLFNAGHACDEPAWWDAGWRLEMR